MGLAAYKRRKFGKLMHRLLSVHADTFSQAAPFAVAELLALEEDRPHQFWQAMPKAKPDELDAEGEACSSAYLLACSDASLFACLMVYPHDAVWRALQLAGYFHG